MESIPLLSSRIQPNSPVLIPNLPTQSRQLFVVSFQRLRAFHEAVMQILVRAFELAFHRAPALQLALQLARTPSDPQMQQHDAREHAHDCGAQQGKKREFDA